MVLASDAPAGLRETLELRQSTQAATWQLCGRGPGGVGGVGGLRFAVQGTVLPGDEAASRGSRRLLEVLEALAPAASSRTMTRADALTAAVLAPLRDQVARRTVDRLAVLKREPDDLAGGALGFFGGVVPYPLVVVQGAPGERFRATADRALAAVGPLPAVAWADRGGLGRFAVVAVIILAQPALHFVTIATSRSDQRRVEGLATIDRPPVIVEATRAAVTD